MGIDYHALQFLCFATKYAPLGRVATIGHQELCIDKKELCRLIHCEAKVRDEKYCDALLLHHLGATAVDSWDYSAYEGATHIFDMNRPLNMEVSPYDTVIDAGSLEHVYNAPQALLNLSQLCRDGGQIIHVSPGNNFCGHGFWQFSPELFYSLYSESNGYSGTRVFLANAYRTDVWYEVIKPDRGERANVVTFTPTFVFCRTVKTRHSGHNNVQQSDYVHIWQQDQTGRPTVPPRPMWREKVRSALHASALIDLAYFAYIKLSGKWSLSARNPHLTAHSVRSLVQ